MKTTASSLRLALALTAAAGFAAAQEPNGPPSEGQRPPRGPRGPGMEQPHVVPPFIQALDANGDRVIDAQEIAGAAAALKGLDKNGDGQLTREELLPPPPEGIGGRRGPEGGRPKAGPGVTNAPPSEAGHRPIRRPMLPPILVALDADKDAAISGAEMTGAPDALKELDKDGDGQLTVEELRPPRPEGMGEGRGPGRGGEGRGRRPGGFGGEGDAGGPPPPPPAAE